MNKKRFIIVTMLFAIMSLFTGVLVNAQDDNWCNEGQPWGDGRCDNADPYVASYMWQMGWYLANDIDPESVLSESAGTAAVDDSYATCKSSGYFAADEGVLANDTGDGIEVIDYSGLSHGGDVTVWADGSFRFSDAQKSGEHTFTYTITGGNTATVVIDICE